VGNEELDVSCCPQVAETCAAEMPNEADIRDDETGDDDEDEGGCPGGNFVGSNAVVCQCETSRGCLGEVYLNVGFVFCVFMTSAERSRNVHTLETVNCAPELWVTLTYLAPMTMVLLLRTNFSISVYTPPGIVPNAVICQHVPLPFAQRVSYVQ
jgi:hypothetical protein